MKLVFALLTSAAAMNPKALSVRGGGAIGPVNEDLALGLGRTFAGLTIGSAVLERPPPRAGRPDLEVGEDLGAPQRVRRSVAAPPRLPRGYSVESDAAGAAWIVPRDHEASRQHIRRVPLILKAP